MTAYQDDYFRFKSIRDPLYGFVELSETETRIIDTRAFRRLHRIKQLSHTYLVYPTAIHTRFEHAIGVTHLADLMSKQLRFPDEIREIVRLAGLLHDIGHGPFSHLFEHVMRAVNGTGSEYGNIHEKISLMLIREDPDISSVLGDMGERIIQLLDHRQISGLDRGLSSLATDVISGPLDVDKMDYLRRDSYNIGVTYGQFDLPRIIHTITNTDDHAEQKICVDVKGKDAIESYRLGRYLMHAQVYGHHTRLAGDQMFLQALDLAVNEENIISNDALRTDTNLEKSHREFLDFYTSLDDYNLYDRILDRPESKAAKILNRIQVRDLLKPAINGLSGVEISNAQIRNQISRMNHDAIRMLSHEIAKHVGVEKHDVIAYLSEVEVKLYDGQILIMQNGTPKTMDELSPINVPKSQVKKFYVFGPDAHKERIRAYVDDKFKLKIT